MKIFVTGATGLVGANLVRLIDKEGIGQMRVLVRPTSNLLPLKGLKSVKTCLGDVTDLESVKRGMKGCSVVFHVAGCVYMGDQPKGVAQLKKVNVEGTRNVCQAALQQKVKKFVLTSSASTIGFAPPGKEADEESDNSHLDRGGWPYARSKKQGEAVVQRFVKKGLPAVIVNPSFMLGEWDIKPSSGKIILAVAKWGLPFYPTGGINVIDVADAAWGHILAMEKGRIGERYILGNKNMSYKDLLTLIHKVVGRKPPRLPLYKGPALLLVRLLSPIVPWLPEEVQDVVSASALKSASETLPISSQKAIRELGLPQSSVKQAIQKSYRWLKKYGYLTEDESRERERS